MHSYILDSVKEQQQKYAFGNAIGILYLLDPVLLGEDILDEHKVKPEDEIFNTFSFGVIIIENCYIQYDVNNYLLSIPTGSLRIKLIRPRMTSSSKCYQNEKMHASIIG